MMPSMSSVAFMKPLDALLVVCDGISIIFGLTRASFNVGKKNISSRVQSDDAVAVDGKLSCPKYLNRPMEYTGDGWTEVVHFEQQFEGEIISLVHFV